MSSQTTEKIETLRGEGRAAFMTYLPVGFPDVAGSVDAVRAVIDAGADIVELGVPYSDPVMDGSVIQRATQAALAGGVRLRDLFHVVEQVAGQVPIVVMTYFNPVLAYGVDAFARDLAAAGGAGLITPDLIPDEAEEWIAASDEHGLDRIFLAAPTSSDERLKLITESSTGFVYTVSTLGITGARADVDRAARGLADRLHAAGCERACVGIGISTAAQVREVLDYAEGAIVGSALVRSLAEGGVDAVARIAAELHQGTLR